MPALVRIEQRFDILMTFAETCEEMEGNFECAFEHYTRSKVKKRLLDKMLLAVPKCLA